MVINNLKPIFDQSGLQYTIDLYNEGIPGPNDTNAAVVKDYARQLWRDFVAQHGKTKTIGLSVIGNLFVGSGPQMKSTLEYIYTHCCPVKGRIDSTG